MFFDLKEKEIPKRGLLLQGQEGLRVSEVRLSQAPAECCVEGKE